MKENKEKKESYKLSNPPTKKVSEQKFIHRMAWLKVAAMLSFLMATFQAFISIFPSAAAYFEAPPTLLENRLLLLITGGSATLILVIFGLYALSGSGKIRPLPLLRMVLVIISSLFLLRGSFIILTILKFLNIIKGEILIQGLISHLVFLGTGISYTVGTILNWRKMSKKIQL